MCKAEGEDSDMGIRILVVNGTDTICESRPRSEDIIDEKYGAMVEHGATG